MRFGVRTKSVQNVEDVEDPEEGDDNGDGMLFSHILLIIFILPCG